MNKNVPCNKQEKITVHSIQSQEIDFTEHNYRKYLA